MWWRRWRSEASTSFVRLNTIAMFYMWRLFYLKGQDGIKHINAFGLQLYSKA
jgi:hypothetical protein